jgi:DNA-binding response OmpR family regulator
MNPTTSKRVAIVDGDDRFGVRIARSLAALGHVVGLAATATGARQLLQSPTDILLLGGGLRDGIGFSSICELRCQTDEPTVIVMATREEKLEHLSDLNEDIRVLLKPFRLSELLSCAGLNGESEKPMHIQQQRIVAGDVTVELRSRQVWMSGVEVRMRTKEFDLLAVLVANLGVVVRRDDLMKQVWNENWCGSTKTLDVHVAALRRRLGEGSPTISRITSLRGFGYRFDPRD